VSNTAVTLLVVGVLVLGLVAWIAIDWLIAGRIRKRLSGDVPLSAELSDRSAVRRTRNGKLRDDLEERSNRYWGP
jgi:hypothetical protein